MADALKLRGGEALAQKILKGSKAFGLGTQNLKVPNAATEAQFRKNRRVVFIVRQVTFIPPPPPPPPPPSSIIEDRFTVKLIRGGAVTLGDFGIESVTVTATIEITDNIDKKSAQFISASTGGGFGGGPFPINVSINFDPGEEVPFKTFRLTRTPIGLNSFEGMVTVFVDPGTGIGPASKGATLSFSFDGLQTNGANTMPQVIRVAAGNSSLTGPTIGLGAVTIGRLTMKGTPADL